MWDLSSPTKDRTRVACIGRQILNHWITREVSGSCVFINSANLCLLIEEFNPFTFKVIADMERLLSF